MFRIGTECVLLFIGSRPINDDVMWGVQHFQNTCHTEFQSMLSNSMSIAA